ncbi:MAG: SDR family NAD(P)-dependent oxidoreductase, partial [Oscillospiraceae bacterium]
MKYALITGAAGGLAGACVEELNNRGGWTIFAADFNEVGLKDLVSKTSDHVIPIVMNIISQENCFEAAEEVKKQIGAASSAMTE